MMKNIEINQAHHTKGFTLTELMVTVAVLAIIIMFAVPGFNRLIERERIGTDAHSILNFMQTAQEIAISTGRIIAIVPNADSAKNGLQHEVKAEIGGIGNAKNDNAQRWMNNEWVMVFVNPITHAEHLQIANKKPGDFLTSLYTDDVTDPSRVIAHQKVLQYPTVGQKSPVIMRSYSNFTPNNGWEALFAINGVGPMLFYPDGVINAPLIFLGENARGKGDGEAREPNGKEQLLYAVGLCAPKDPSAKNSGTSNYVLGIHRFDGSVLANVTNISNNNALKDLRCEAY